LTPLALPPDWNRLDQFQETITHDEFVSLLDLVYAPESEAPWITVEPEQAVIQKNATDRFLLRFAPDIHSRKSLTRYWSINLVNPTADKPLCGLRIALDPGHLGGAWAKMEERWFQIGVLLPITEGDMTLRVAQLLARRLRVLGAKVDLVRSKSGPVTSWRPNRLQSQAQASLQDRGVTQPLSTYSGPTDPNRERAIPWEAERLFYRVAEIRERARIVNDKLKPDLMICLHFNAESWGDPLHPTLDTKNHLHLLVNGAYSKMELGYDDVRFTMLIKLLNRAYDEELPISESVAQSLAEATGLPPYSYSSPNAKQVGKTRYVWARNLIANRLYECPVIYIEPYVMNSKEVFVRVQAGAYDGVRDFGGVMRKNIYVEYADAVVTGLVRHFRVQSYTTER
jgi:N-acetylmuramoyl-L-alanine amidase